MAEAPRYVLGASVATNWYLEDEQSTEQALAPFRDFR